MASAGSAAGRGTRRRVKFVRAESRGTSSCLELPSLVAISSEWLDVTLVLLSQFLHSYGLLLDLS
jgi:hypothetical protein